MDKDENRLLTHLQKIPDCLTQFEITASNWSQPEAQGGALSIERSIRCPCGNENLVLQAAQRKELRGVCSKSEIIRFKPPVYVICPACSRTTLLFDPEIHGWNGESGLVRGVESTFTLAKCIPQPGRVRVVITYKDFSVYGQLLEKGVVNIQDYFDSFTLCYFNSADGNFIQVISHSCA